MSAPLAPGDQLRNLLEDLWFDRKPTLPRVTKKPELAQASPETTTGYVIRELFGQQDVAVLRHAREQREHVLLSGPPGVGKTALLTAAFPESIKVLCHPEMEVAELRGDVDKLNGEWTFFPGPLTRAMMQGVPLFVDELGKAPTAIQSLLLGVTDDTTWADRPDSKPFKTGDPKDPEGVLAQPGFIVIAAWNPNLRGARLDDALISRFTWVTTVETEMSLVGDLGVPKRLQNFAERIHAAIQVGTMVTIPWGPQTRDLLQMTSTAQVIGEPQAALMWLTKMAQINNINPNDAVAECSEIIHSIWRSSDATQPARLGARWTKTLKAPEDPALITNLNVEGL